MEHLHRGTFSQMLCSNGVVRTSRHPSRAAVDRVPLSI